MKARSVIVGLWVSGLLGCGAEPADQAPPPTEDAPPSATAPADNELISPVDGVTLSYVESNGIRMRIAEAGSGPVVLFAHGWPESWFSWRHQLTALAAAGYRAIAPDMRGYGRTDAPLDVENYGIQHTSRDLVGILDALGIERATMVGHDWGAPVAAHTVLTHPERFDGLVLMSVPHNQRSDTSPMAAMQAGFGDNFFYILYHNEPGGVAEADYDADPRGLLSRLYLSPDSPRHPPEVTDPARAAGGWIPRLGAPKGLPDWLSQAELDYYVAEFERTGFRGGINYYRNIEANWAYNADLDQVMPVPVLFIAGEQDIVIGGADADQLATMMSSVVPNLHEVVLLPGIGHWVQQEAPEETNAAMLEFLASLAEE